MKNTLNVEKLTERSQKLGLNQSGIAKKLDVTRAAVSQWFKNEKFPRPDKLLKLARILDLTFADMVIKLPEPDDPVVVSREKDAHKIKREYFEQVQDIKRIFARLAPHLSFDDLVLPPFLKSPSTSYDYVQKAARRVRTEIGIKESEEMPFLKLIRFFNDLHSVIIPVLWGNNDKHENAFHIYLPDSMTTWIYLNLDCRVHDFKFWMAHELGHVYTPKLDADEGEFFADAFAGALLVPEKLAAREYVQLCRLKSNGERINHIKAVAKRLVVSPATIYSEVSNYAIHYKRPRIKINTIQHATNDFNNQCDMLSKCLFETEKPTPAQYITSAREVFGSQFFEVLRKYIVKNRKSGSFIQSILNIPILDAQNVHEELC